MRQRDDVEQRIPIDDDDVGELARLDRSAIRQAEYAARVDARGGHDRPLRRHPHIDVCLDLTPQRLGVEVHRRPGIGAHAHDCARLDELFEAPLAEEHLAVGSREVHQALKVF